MRIDALKTTAASSKVTPQQDKKLKNACKDFEAMFLGTLMKAMRKTVQKSDLFGSDQGEEIFQDMMDTEVCKSAANTSSMGISDILYRQLTSDLDRGQEAKANQNRGVSK